MPCFHPLQARYDGYHPSGKKKLHFFKKSDIDFGDCKHLVDLQLPCGRCDGCRLERSRQWAIRCVHESKLHEQNCFITLTFNNENLPIHNSLDHSIFQRFMKRLRKRCGNGIKFYMAGEYGEVCRDCSLSRVYCSCVRFNRTLGRPHFHACIFGYDFPDRVLFKQRDGVKLYKSQLLSDIWGHGNVSVGDVTFESAAYIARYIAKKVLGKDAQNYYLEHGFLDSNGELFAKKPEYTRMSNRVAIGKDYYKLFKDDFYPSDQCVVRDGVVMQPPKYYDKLHDLDNPEEMALVKSKRVYRAEQRWFDNLPERLSVREKCHLLKMERFKRNLEE